MEETRLAEIEAEIRWQQDNGRDVEVTLARELLAEVRRLQGGAEQPAEEPCFFCQLPPRQCACSLEGMC